MEHLIKEYRSFRVKMIQPTDFKGARISLKDEYLNKRVELPMDYAFRDPIRIVINYLGSKGIVIKGMVKRVDETLLLSDDYSKGL